jgi:hypothetical protein
MTRLLTVFQEPHKLTEPIINIFFNCNFLFNIKMENNYNLNEVIKLPKRKLVVSSSEIILDKKNYENIVFILMVEESFGSAGGRGGGSGNRKIDKIMGFNIDNNKKDLIFQTEDQNIIENFDIPYSAVAMDIILESGQQFVVQGIVDQEMIKSYMKIIE